MRARRNIGQILRILASLVLVASLAGCLRGREHRLETGYQYQPLNSSSLERRAFYADPFSIEARRAEEQRQQRQSGGNPLLGGG